MMTLSAHWLIDPLPVCVEFDRNSMAWWRWWSAEVLKARQADVSAGIGGIPL